MKNCRITKRLVTAAILSVLIMALLCTSALAASYSNTYGRTKDRLRVRASASQSATVIDNILKDACVYVSTSKVSGAATFVKVTYRNLDGNIDTGWICQHDGNESLVTILSATQAQSLYGVKSGNLPSKKVGTFTASERAAAEKKAGSVDSGSIDTDTIKDAQRMLKGLDYYTGEITGHVGDKTESAIKKFQRDYNLSADGVVGPNTYSKLQSVYASKGGSSSSSSSSGSGLRLNSSGTDVRNLQQDLTTLKYYWAEVTGNYGEKTETAVKRFQEDNNLTADGVAGQKTLDAIAAALNRSGLSSSSSISTSGTLSLGSKSEAVRDMQTALKALGYYTGSITGSFGDLTEKAVREFQRANKLTEDGIAGPATIREINAQAGSGSGSSSASRLDLGSTGQLVHALQRDLTALGYYYGDITSHYGELTKQAVKKFQKDNGLTADGVAGTSTQNAISRKLGNSGSLASANSSADSLRLGDSGTAVTDLQTRLEKLDYYYGEITGNFGSLTERAVKKFQDDNDLSVDGVAGSKTMSLLYQKTGGTYTGTSSGESNVNLYGRITANNVSLRQSYSKSSKAVVELDSGKVMRITKSLTVDGMVWYYGYVEKGSYTYKGYMRSDYVTLINDSDYVAGGGNEIDVGDDEILGMIRVTGDKVSIREDHSNDSDRVGYAYKDDVYYYINTRSYDDGWYQIASGGWISKKYCVKLSASEMDQYAGLGSSSQTSYRIGDKGSMVTWIQEALDELDYYDGEITGNYGNLTHDAVQDFQRDHGLSGDGIAGEKTIAAISAALSSSGSTSSVGSTAPKGPIIYNLDWFSYKNYLTSSSHFNLKTGAYATLTDIETGKSFDIKIQSTGNHIDAEPRDAEDTAILAYVYGKSSGVGLKGVYQRRPMVLTSSTGKSVVVSIYPDPHGLDTISGNNYDGQFCLHMKNSKTHGTDRVDYDDNGHQEMIEKGVSYLLNNQFERDYYSISTAYPATAASLTTNKKGTHSSGSNSSSDNGSTGGISSAPTSKPTATPKPTPTPTPKPTMYSKTNAYTNPNKNSNYYHDNYYCTTMGNAGGPTNWGTTYSVVKGKTLCDDCNSTYVYFGAEGWYHYDPNCSHMLSADYDTIYKTTEFTAKKLNWQHTCTTCKK